MNLLLLILTLFYSEANADSISEANYNRAKTYYFTHQDSTIYYARRLEETQTNSDLNHARAFHLLGTIKQLKSESDSGLVYFKKMLKYSENASDSSLISIALLSKGLMFVNLGNFDSAMYCYSMGEKIAELAHQERFELRAMAEIARLSSLMGDHDKALLKCREYYYKVKNTSNLNDLVTAIAYLSVEFMHFHENDSALFYTNQALILQRQLGNSPGVAAALLNKASIFQDLMMTDSAIFYFEKAKETYLHAHFTQGLGQLNLNLATLFMNTNNSKKAAKTLEEGIGYSKQIHDLHALREEFRLLSDVYQNLGRTDDAYSALKNFILYSDSIYSIDKEHEIRDLQTKYETEKKEQKIALQQVQLSEQHAQNERNLVLIWSLALFSGLLIVIILLVRSRARKKQHLIQKEVEIKLKEALLSSAISSQENERKRFARDLHDGFGQMISVLNLNLRSLEKGASDREAIFENSSQVLDEMYKELKSICFNLMPETLIKNGVPDALREFASRINLADKVFVRVDAFGLERRLLDLLEINIYRISQEWINNVIKYSDATTINLQLTKDETEITLLIEDNGSGFDKELLTKGKGNGWKNMQSRSNLMKGELELDTTPGTMGNTLILNVPIEISANQTVDAD